MALLFFDGYEGLGAAATNPADAIVSRRYNVSDANDITPQTGVYGGLSFRYADETSTYQIYAGPDSGNVSTEATKIWAVSLNCPAQFDWPVSTPYIFRLVTDTSQWSVGLKIDIDGCMELVDADENTLAIATHVLRQRAWNRIELKVYCHASSGTAEVRVDGVTVINETGIDTAGTSNGTSHTRAYMYAFTGGTSGAPRYDNLVICDTTGNTCNDFLGPVNVKNFYATSDDVAEWSPSSGGDNYAMVDENPPDDSTTYVSETATNNVATFDTGNLDSTADTVLGVRLTTDAALSAAGSESYKQVVKSGGTEYTGNVHALTSTSWVYMTAYWDEDPDTAAAWTVNGANASLFGLEMQ
jgi:hypothetical protein